MGLWVSVTKKHLNIETQQCKLVLYQLLWYMHVNNMDISACSSHMPLSICATFLIVTLQEVVVS